MSCSETCWLLGGAWFQCMHGDFLMTSYQLMFPGVRSFLSSQILDLSLLPLAFSLILTVVSWLLHPYSTDDKASRTGHGTKIGSKLGKEYIKAVYCHPAYLTYMQSTSCEMPDWMKHNLESRFWEKYQYLRYADDTTFMAESKEEVKSLLMKVKEESEKSWLKIQHSKN